MMLFFAVLFGLVVAANGFANNPGPLPVPRVHLVLPSPLKLPLGVRQPDILAMRSASNDDGSDEGAAASFFNGGKMRHLFPFDTNYCYKTDGTFTSPEAETALCDGTFYHKIDGSNGMIQVVHASSNGEVPKLKVYERRDTRGKGDTWEGQQLTPLPTGKNTDTYPGHTYYFYEVTTDVAGKKMEKRNRAMLDTVERHKDNFLVLNREWISVEWVGTKFQQTPGVPHDVALAIHEDQILDTETAETIERTYEGLKKYLEDCAENPVEGLIVAHEGVYWKVTTGGFFSSNSVQNPFAKNRANGKTPRFMV